MKIDTLIIMQERCRDCEQIPHMVEYMRAGGFWTLGALKDPHGMIYIIVFPDGRMMIHDGHHRVLATYLAGRDYLRDDEFECGLWAYESYMEVNWNLGYYTPHDPRTEVRLPNFLAFKKNVCNILATDGEIEAKKYIRDCKHLYAKTRELWTVAEMAKVYFNERRNERKTTRNPRGSTKSHAWR